MIGILILNYKKYQVTADCIRSVLDTGDGLDYHIYVLDNGSGNDSIACLQAQFPNNPRITWMESAENTGYARGNNQMLSRARKDGCTAAVITNSDIVFLPGTLQQLAADIAAWDARFEGSVTLWYGYSLGQVTDGASTVGGSATALGVRNLVVEVPAKQTMDDTARNELRNTLSASGVEHAVFWDDAAGIFQ